MGSDLVMAAPAAQAHKGAKVAEAAEHVLALRPDLESLLKDLKAEGTGRAQCFLQALDELRATLDEPLF